MITIEGTVTNGLGTAHQNLMTQLPQIVTEFPEIAGVHLGTINLQLNIPLVVIAPDHRTRPIQWMPAGNPPETFDLLRIEIEAPVNTQRVGAWLYIAHFSPHRQTPHVHEVLGPKLPVTLGTKCRLHIDRAAGQLPHPAYPAVLIL